MNFSSLHHGFLGRIHTRRNRTSVTCQLGHIDGGPSVSGAPTQAGPQIGLLNPFAVCTWTCYTSHMCDTSGTSCVTADVSVLGHRLHASDDMELIAQCVQWGEGAKVERAGERSRERLPRRICCVFPHSAELLIGFLRIFRQRCQEERGIFLLLHLNLVLAIS